MRRRRKKKIGWRREKLDESSVDSRQQHAVAGSNGASRHLLPATGGSKSN
jgi:hypothetical protein